MEKEGQRITAKISFENDLRRVSFDSNGSWSDVVAHIRKLYKQLTDEEWQNIQIKYKDDEGDWITISSTEELKEALSILDDGALLRLQLERTKPENKWCGGGENQRRGGWGRRKCGGGWGGWGGWGRHCARQQQQQQTENNNTCPVNQQNPLGQIFESLKPLFGEFQKERQNQCGGGWRRGGCNWGGARMGWWKLHRQIMALFDAGTKDDLEAARALLLEQSKLIENNSTTIYNLACVEALLGNTKEALVYLEKAINAGFRDVKHIETDNDLVSLRNLEGFKALIASLKNPGVAPSEPPKSETLPQEPEVQEPEKPVEPEQPEQPTLHPIEINLNILQEMGWTDRAQNIRLLIQTNNDLNRVVEILLKQY